MVLSDSLPNKAAGLCRAAKSERENEQERLWLLREENKKITIKFRHELHF